MSVARLARALSGASVRLHASPIPFGPRAIVAVARTHDDATPAVVANPRHLSCLLTFEPGCFRPDATGQEMLMEALQRQGTGLLAFASLADASRAASWLQAMATAGGQA